MSIEQRIDDLYKGPADGFVAARNALAKTLKGGEARRVRQLAKPTVGAWAVNQLYWHARAAYDRLTETGAKLRAAQIAALSGGTPDLRAKAAAHRAALARAADEAMRRAASAGVHPSLDEVTRTLEAASLATDVPDRPGRFTRVLRPAGFEALAGVKLTAVPRAPAAPDGRAPEEPRGRRDADESRAKARARAASARAAAAARGRARRLARAEALVARAARAEEQARGALERARARREAAELALAALRG